MLLYGVSMFFPYKWDVHVLIAIPERLYCYFAAQTIKTVKYTSFSFYHIFHFQDFCAPEPPFIPTNFSRQGSSGGSRIVGPLFVPLPNSTALGWASNVTAPAAWPPLTSLRLLISQEGQSCVEACQSAGFICEPAHFRFINNKEALHG